ncbi:MAG: sigma-70 family RNA polymerase sigma factor [Ruminococcus sp.]|nr:sigma-70 family RNA polymerase sigma factor [Ruminococcus sp.]
MEDTDIVELYLNRNDRAVEETKKKFGVYCKTIAQNILHDSRDIEEAVNETWLKAWISIPPAEPKVLAAFLGGITRNISLNIIRKDSAKKRSLSYAESYEELDELMGGGDIEDEFDAKELENAVNVFVEKLPKIQRDVFICRYIYFESIDRIADRFGYSRGKVKSMLFRIRKRLKETLDEEGLL